MFPAARKFDPLTHDMLIASGVVGLPVPGPCPPGVTGPVMIEFLPAAHAVPNGCIALCTGVITGGIVHPPVPTTPFGTPIVKGSTSVMIHSMPAARWFTSGDIAGCSCLIGLPTMLASRRVFIGG